jgi:hypothetical protein
MGILRNNMDKKRLLYHSLERSTAYVFLLKYLWYAVRVAVYGRETLLATVKRVLAG